MSFGPAIVSRLAGTLPRLTFEEINLAFNRANLSRENILLSFKYFSCLPLDMLGFTLRRPCESLLFQSILSKMVVVFLGIASYSCSRVFESDNGPKLFDRATGLTTFFPKNENCRSVPVPTPPLFAPILVPADVKLYIPDPPHDCPPHCPCISPGGCPYGGGIDDCCADNCP